MMNGVPWWLYMFKCKTKPQKCPKSKVRFIKKHTYTRYHITATAVPVLRRHIQIPCTFPHTLSLSMLETIYSNFHQPSEIFSFYLIQYLLDNCQCYTNSHANKIVYASVDGGRRIFFATVVVIVCVCVFFYCTYICVYCHGRQGKHI